MKEAPVKNVVLVMPHVAAVTIILTEMAYAKVTEHVTMCFSYA